MKRIAIAIIFGLLVCGGGTAKAALITETFDFTASDFTISVGSTPPPVDPVIGSVTVSFDTSVQVVGQTAGITLNSLNLALDSAVAYSYAPAGNLLEIGGIENDVIDTDPNTNDFLLVIHSATTATPTSNTFHYTGQGTADFYSSTDVSLAVEPAPEPGTLLLLGSAVTWLGLSRRPRRG